MAVDFAVCWNDKTAKNGGFALIAELTNQVLYQLS
jgi:hypothetical protein